MAVVVACLGVTGAARAQNHPEDRWAAGLTAGSDGVGLDLKYKLSPTLVLRARGAGIDFSDTENSDGIRYHGRVKFATGGGFLDWHPFANGFLLSGGVVAGEREVTLSGAAEADVTIQGHTYTPAQIGSVDGRAKLPGAAGFLGVGYDSTFVQRGRIGFNVLAGVQLSGAPKVQLASNGLLATTPQLINDLMHEEDEVRHDLNFTKYYPALSLGLTYRF